MPVTKTVQLTIAGVAKAIADRDDIVKKERGEICSALKRLTEIVGADPHSTLADPAILRKYFASGKWMQQGLTKKGWANLRSRVTKGLHLVGIDVHRTRANYAVGPQWESLLVRLPGLVARDLRRFAGWCTGLGVEPDAVSPETFSNYLNYCTALMTHRRPRERWHVARRAWNRIVGSGLVPTAVMIEAAPLSAWTILKWGELPVSLKDDFDAFVAERNRKSLFLLSHRSSLREVTIENYERKLRTLATCLVDAGVPAGSISTLPALLTPQNVKKGLEEYLRNDDPNELPSRLDSVGIAVCAVVRWLAETGRFGQGDLLAVRQLCKTVKHRPSAMCDRNVERLTQFKDPKIIEAFLSLPYVVFDRLLRVDTPTVRHAQDAQMAILLNILIHAPVRILNASQLSLSANMSQTRINGQLIWLLDWQEHEVKNKVAVRHQLSVSCSRLLDVYLARYRPLLIKNATPKLFLSQSGSPKCAAALGKQLTRFIARETGIVFNPHVIRHVMAYLFLRKHPGHYETVRRLLGHKSIQTTIKFYAGFEKESDQTLFDAMISSYRDGNPRQLSGVDQL